MSSEPKILLFDIGGVCVVSPFQAILDYEARHNIPQGYVNYAISASKPDGAWHRLEKGIVPLDATWFAAFRADLCRASVWKTYHDRVGRAVTTTEPDIDAEELYWMMMRIAQTVDPVMGPALRRLKEKGYRLAALSNTSIFPDGHPLGVAIVDDIRNVFEVFISSAHVGMRKPDRDIYEFTMQKLKERWGDIDLKPGDVLFLDDIGENLKMGRSMGWRTIKVQLGRTRDAVKKLEEFTGEVLLEGEKAKL